MTPEQDMSHEEKKRLQHAAEALLENEIFRRMFEEMEGALMEQMKLTVPDDPRFILLGRHLHVLGDIEQFIKSYIEDGMMSDAYRETLKTLN